MRARRWDVAERVWMLGFDLPVSIDTYLINVVIYRRLGGDGQVVCRVGGSGSCSPSGGWFTFDDDTVALCDQSCLDFERAGSEAVVVAELAAASRSVVGQRGGSSRSRHHLAQAGRRKHRRLPHLP